jgi:murein DD-endopeptidase MepM/ murein hydrolase activator NlpD
MEGETPAQFEERQLEQVRQALQRGEILQFAAGNYVILQHPEGECSAYLHLKEDSIRVKVGETVSCGQHIADVGNTGDSFGAHLHFQVLDKPDMASGRSLPFSFKNIEKELTEPAWFVHTNG